VNSIYKNIIRPFLFSLDAEHAHNVACKALSLTEHSKLSRKLIQLISSTSTSKLNLFGLTFRNQIGLAAGMDKNGQFPKSFSSLGFGHIEIGTVTPKPQIGNPKPRLFRYPAYSAIINRMGFNNDGVEAIVKRIERIYPKEKRISPLGINIGKGKHTPIENALDDYIFCLNKSFNQADYITVNISSPNTPNLRELHKSSLISPLLKSLSMENMECARKFNKDPIPLLLKISPDENFKTLEFIITSAVENGFSGVIATNTSVSRFHNENYESFETGGLSGNPIKYKSTEIINFIAKLTDFKFPIIGVGGISSVNSALQKIDAGAILLQLYSGLIYQGPLLPSYLINSMAKRTNKWI
jgi:dihydroorotate dehydrogenase